jgi:hypothetical protein
MPTFKPLTAHPSIIPGGCYVAKVVEARERFSNNGNEMIVMEIQLAGSGTLPCILTFVEKARTAISAFCRSANMVFPDGDEADVKLTAANCLDRYLYVVVTNETDQLTGAVSRISRFLSREEALVVNPALSRVTLKEQAPLLLQSAQAKTNPPLF